MGVNGTNTPPAEHANYNFLLNSTELAKITTAAYYDGATAALFPQIKFEAPDNIGSGSTPRTDYYHGLRRIY